MNPKRAVKDLERQLRKQPGSLVVRIRLASALHAAGRLPEAVDLYRSVAMAYFTQGRLEQAMAVCHSLLEIAPMHRDTQLLLAELDSHRVRQAQSAGEPGVEAVGSGATPGWPEQAEPAPRARRETSTPFRPSTPWRESGPFRRETIGSPFRDTPDPGSGPITTPGPTPPVPAPPHGREGSHPPGGRPSGLPAGPSPGPGSVASRLPLQVVRTLNGVGPPTVERVRGSSEPGTPATARYRRPSAPPVRPLTARPRLPLEADEDAPTHIADKWSSDVPRPPPIVPGPPGGAMPPAGRSRPSGGLYSIHNPRGPLGSNRVPTYRARPRHVLAGEPSGDPADATEYDEGMELARALGRGMGEEPVLDAPGKLPLLPGLSERAVEAIAAGMVRRRSSAGELIVRDGESGDSCFVLARGEARVLKRDPLLPRGDLVEVNRLADGDLFGEVAMMGDRRRHASVQAVSDCELLEIPRAHLAVVGGRFPEVEAFLQQFYRERLIATLVATAGFFRPLDPGLRTSLLSHFRFSHADPGTTIVGEGERAGGFFLIVLGAVEITKRVSERRQVLLATLGEGTYFGEMSLLRGEPARASVVATETVELAVLPAKNFYALVANHPVLWDQVRQEAHRRELEMVQIVTGLSGTV